MSQPYSISLKTTWQNILSDLSRYRVTDNRPYIVLFIICPGMFAGIYYRIGHWLWYPAEMNAKYLYLLRPLYIIGKRFMEIYAGASLSPQARIGRGLYINHFGSIIIGPCLIGENCNIAQEVSIGFSGRGDKRGLPTLGDRVLIGPGAKILGPVTIGNDVAIGANAVITKDLADCAVAVGVPAKTISYKGSFDYILYKNMECDPARLKSLHERDMWQIVPMSLLTREKVKS